MREVRLQLEYNARRRASQPAPLVAADDRRLLDGLALYERDGTLLSGVGRCAGGRARCARRAADRAAVVRLADGSSALAVAPALESGGAELVGIVSLARLVPLLEVRASERARRLSRWSTDDGRVLARAGRAAERRAARAHRRRARCTRARALRETEISGEHVIAAAQRVALLDWSVAILTPFETAYAPVFSVVTRVFAIDLCIILVFSFLAYRITARVLRPIGHLSEAVQRANARRATSSSRSPRCRRATRSGCSPARSTT